MKIDKVIITGGAGFIGSNLITGLNEIDFQEIIAVDLLGNDEKWKNLQRGRFLDFVNGRDFRNDFVSKDRDFFPPGTRCAVLHMGACSSTTETDADYMMDNNFTYTKELAEWCLKRDYRFVYASSAATYGDGSEGYSDMADPYKLKPLNVYGYSKHLFDLHALQKGWLDKIAGIKFFNVYGMGERHKDDMRSVVHKSFDQIRENGRVKLFESHREGIGHGEQRRDFVYVKDAVAETLFLAGTPEANGLFNMGSGVANTFRDLVEATFSAMDLEPVIDYIPMPEYLREKYQYYTRAEMEKVRDKGFHAKLHTLNDGVADYVAWLKKESSD